MKRFLTAFLALLPLLTVIGQNPKVIPFKQLDEELPTPNTYRTASGAPGHEYWQQKADYDITIRLDDAQQRIYGEEVITYTNNSPDKLTYLWLQLDQNMRAKTSDTYKIEQENWGDSVTFDQMKNLAHDFDGGHNIEWVKDKAGKDLPYTINKTMMRVDLPQPLASKGTYSFKIKWWYNVQDRMQYGGRSGYEYFKAEDNYLYTIAQFFPRMCVYSDNTGWQHKQFLGRGEFTLPFGDYKVSITVPEDHIVAASGVLQNVDNVLTAAQKSRMAQANNATTSPVMIVTPQEALDKEKLKASGTKTWVFKADNVRDFAFASSRKFIWDAMAVKFGSRTVLAMSYYPKEGNPLWEKYSTRVVAHTVKTYSKFSFDYPYPVAISVHTDRIGMEYPMICFNGGRPEADGTYSESTKYGMIGVIIHEVGHNFFPMIVNSDERQWTWMDEGLNTFLQYLTEQEWDVNYPSRRGPAYKIVDYMKGDKSLIAPIMTNSESIYQFGNNAYGKPCTALNILRETVMGRELFDYAFKEYCRRWMFKHPTPADFFRTMEDASGVDLDWFWRGWFYGTQHVDQSLDYVRWLQPSKMDPAADLARKKEYDAQRQTNISTTRNKDYETVVKNDPTMRDYYTDRNVYEPLATDVKMAENKRGKLTDEELALLAQNDNLYQVAVTNVGGLVMPIILQFIYVDGTDTVFHIPAEIWKMGDATVYKVFNTGPKEVAEILLDPFLEIADIDVTNNAWPQRLQPSRIELYKRREYQRQNEMQRYNKSLEMKKEKGGNLVPEGE